MAVFPLYSTINYINPVSETMRFKTLISTFDDLGVEKRKRKWLYPKRDITIQYEYISLTEARTIFNFYIARQGSYDAFAFFKHETETYTGEYIGTGDGSTTVYNLPCKNSTARSVYLDGASLSEGASGADYAFSALGGTDGEDKITFATAPNKGTRITMDFNGNLKIRCRFAEDELSFDTFYNRLRNVGIKLRGLLNT